MAKFHPLKIKDIRRETDSAVSVAFEVPDPLEQDYQFVQGQYLTLKAIINGEEVRRNYSICVSPLDKELRVAIKQVPMGKFSTYANQVLNVGDTLDVMTPMGRFYTALDAQQAKQYVGFAGGSGITPIISILKTVLQTEPDSNFTLFYANKGFDTIIFREAIEALKNEFMERLRVYHIFSQERLESPLFNGHITKEKVLQFSRLLFDPTNIDEYFICGPEAMMLAIKEALEELGTTSSKIHMELFTTPGKKEVKQAKKAVKESTIDAKHMSQVTIQLDGDFVEFPLAYGGESILDAALDKGADLPYACKGGVCCTCRAKVVEGEVEMEVNYALEPEEVEAGFVLTCQAHPKTSKVLIDFDEK